jgi:hypothetical protein
MKNINPDPHPVMTELKIDPPMSMAILSHLLYTNTISRTTIQDAWQHNITMESKNSNQDQGFHQTPPPEASPSPASPSQQQQIVQIQDSCTMDHLSFITKLTNIYRIAPIMILSDGRLMETFGWWMVVDEMNFVAHVLPTEFGSLIIWGQDIIMAGDVTIFP